LIKNIEDQGFFKVYSNDSKVYQKAKHWWGKNKSKKTCVKETYYDITCELTGKEGEIPKAQTELYLSMEKAGRVLNAMRDEPDPYMDIYFKKLLSLTQVGLCGSKPQPELAAKALKEFKGEVTLLEAKKIKNEYMEKLGFWAFVFSVISLAVLLIPAGLAARLQQPENTDFTVFYYNAVPVLRPYICTWIGAMAGTWISFGARKTTIPFDDLATMEKDLMSAPVRLIYVGLCAVVLVLLFQSQVISITIGSLSTEALTATGAAITTGTAIYNDSSLLTASPGTGILIPTVIGILCGLVESSLGGTLYKKAKSAINTKS
jgi:hypothetical protein